MLLEVFHVAHFVQNPFLYIKYAEKNAGALKSMNEIPLNTHSFYVTALETEVATIGLLSF